MKKIFLLCIFCTVSFSVYSQETFKKNYCIQPIIGHVFLKKDSTVSFKNMNREELEKIEKKYARVDSVMVENQEKFGDDKVTLKRKIRVDANFINALTVERTINVTESFKGFVKFEEDGKIWVNRYSKKDSLGNYKRYPIYYYQLKNRESLALCFKEVTVSAFTIPVKYRFRGTNGLNEDFSTAFNANLFVGLSLGRSTFFYQEKVGNKTNNHLFTLGGFLGVSSITLDKSNTSLNKEPLGDNTTLTKGLTSLGVGVTYAYNKINFGVFAGYDFAVGDAAAKWNYNEKPWLGIALGYSLFNFN